MAARASCVFFAQGRCRNGTACPFSHDGEKPLCLFYASPRGCNNGAACPFRHEGQPVSNLPRYGQAGRGRAGAAMGPPPGEPQLSGPKPAKKKRRKHDPRDLAADIVPLTTAEKAAVLHAIAQLDGKATQKKVRRAAESILGVSEGALDEKRAAVKGVIEDEMSKPAKKKRRKHDPRDIAAARERALLARAATPAATRPPPWYAGGAKANEGNGFIACVGVGRSRIVEFCWPETCAAILATCRRGASDGATVWSALATPIRIVPLATAYVWRASQRARVASQRERAASQRYIAELQAAASRSSRPSLRAPPPVRSMPEMILDFSKLRAGVRTLPLRRACLQELLIRLLPMQPPPPPRTEPEDPYESWDEDLMTLRPSRRARGAPGQNFIGGSYALHDYLSRRDATPPTWAPGDVDFWMPCATHMQSVLAPKGVAGRFTDAARRRLGVELHETYRRGQMIGEADAYTARYNFNMRLASTEVACVVTDVLDLEYVVDLPDWPCRGPYSNYLSPGAGTNSATERLDTLARRGVVIDKISIIGTTPAPRRAKGQARVARGLVPRDILARFDIDVCQVGLTLAAGSDGLPEDDMWPPLRDVCSGQRTYLFGRDDVEGNIRARTAHCLFLDNPRLRDRVAKYEARGFEFAPWEAEHDAAVARMVALEAIFALPKNTKHWQFTQKNLEWQRQWAAAKQAAAAEGVCYDFVRGGCCSRRQGYRLLPGEEICELRHDVDAAKRILAEHKCEVPHFQDEAGRIIGGNDLLDEFLGYARGDVAPRPQAHESEEGMDMRGIRVYAERCFNSCHGELERAAMQRQVQKIFSCVLANGRAREIDWRSAPVPPVPRLARPVAAAPRRRGRGGRRSGRRR